MCKQTRTILVKIYVNPIRGVHSPRENIIIEIMAVFSIEIFKHKKIHLTLLGQIHSFGCVLMRHSVVVSMVNVYNFHVSCIYLTYLQNSHTNTYFDRHSVIYIVCFFNLCIVTGGEIHYIECQSATDAF